jgi:hypothetical protein
MARKFEDGGTRGGLLGAVPMEASARPLVLNDLASPAGPSKGVQVAGSFDNTPDYERALKWVTNHGADATMLDPQRMFVRLPITNADGSEGVESHVVPVGPDGGVSWKMLRSIMGY